MTAFFVIFVIGTLLAALITAYNLIMLGIQDLHYIYKTRRFFRDVERWGNEIC